MTSVNETMHGDFVFAKLEKPREVIDLSQAKPGDVFLTRDGREAKFVGFLPELGELPCLLLVNGQDSIDTYAVDGSYDVGRKSVWDIVAKKPETRVLDVWMNIKSNGQIWDYPSRFDADQNASSDRIACVPLRIEYTEGEGL